MSRRTTARTAMRVNSFMISRLCGGSKARIIVALPNQSHRMRLTAVKQSTAAVRQPTLSTH
jgi:hypothetical protein